MGRREELLMRLMGSRSNNVRNMLAARRRMVDQPMVPTGERSLTPAALIARSPEATAAVREAEELQGMNLGSHLGDAASAGARPIMDGKVVGTFAKTPLEDVGVLGVVSYPSGIPNQGRARGIRRHEVMHGYNEAAHQGMDGMPIWSRVTGSMPRAIRRPLDEVVATRVGGMKYADINWDWYAKLYESQGQLDAARVARALHAAQVAGHRGGQLVRKAADHPMATGAVIGGGGTLLYGLMSGEDGQ